MKLLSILFLFINITSNLFGSNFSSANQNQDIKTFLPPYFIDYSILQETAEKYQNHKEPIYAYSKSLLQEADMWLDSSYSTIVNKTHLPSSGNKHDYYSLGPYWWPDSSKENGLPYIRKDGYRNPERLEYDRPQLGNMIEAVNSLTLAFAISDEDEYKSKAIGFLKTWFINDSTKMNPNLEYGQAIPGITDGRGIGIIETRSLIDVVDAIGILYRKNAFNKYDFEQLQNWFKEYNTWLTTSEKGIDEKNWYNNHGTAYDLQVIS
ncbi:MAG: alginate lyase family protein, partial [Ignavibacteriae bacterium]|nr:alginate lyase family protein [Ignavibacteriota bacterium]